MSIGCEFNICRRDPETGDITNRFRPGDVEHLARLMAIVANAFYRMQADESADDLGCLAHCLSKSLGFDIHEAWTAEADEPVQ